MRENGQTYRLWKKWGSEFSQECLNTDEAHPIVFREVTVAMTIMLSALVFVFFLLLSELFVKKNFKNGRVIRTCKKNIKPFQSTLQHQKLK